MTAFSILRDKYMWWRKSPTSRSRRSDKSCLVTLDPLTAADSSPSNSLQYNKQFKFSVFAHVCYILLSVLNCVKEDNCGLKRNLKWNHLVSTEKTRNFSPSYCFSKLPNSNKSHIPQNKNYNAFHKTWLVGEDCFKPVTGMFLKMCIKSSM